MNTNQYIRRALACAIALLIALLPASMRGQQYLLEDETLYIQPCQDGVDSGRIMAYDIFPYRSYQGWVVIESVAGDTLTLQGTYGIWDGYLRVWDAQPNEGGRLLIDYNWVGEGALNLTSATGVFVIWFHTDSGDDERFDLTWRSLHPELCCSERIDSLTLNSIGEETGGTYSASFSWQSNVPAGSQYTISLDGTVIDTVADTSTTLHGLSASMQHQIGVSLTNSADCGLAAPKALFRTPCTGETTLPLHDNFDDVAIDSIPPCWQKAMNFDDPLNQPRVVEGYSSSRPHSLMLGCGSNSTAGHFSIVTTPKIANGGPWRVTMLLRASHENTRLMVGSADTATASLALSGFSNAETITITSNTQWTRHTITIDGATSGQKLALVMQQGMQDGEMRIIYVDDIQLETCGVSEATATGVFSDSVTVGWTTFGNPTCNLGVRRAGAPSDFRLIRNVTSPFTVDSLEPSTRYTFTIYPHCGSYNGLPASTTARTTSAPVNSICSDFLEAAGEPIGWVMYPFGDCSSCYFGSQRYHFYTGCGGQEGWLVSPELTSLAGKDVSMRINWVNNGAMLCIGVLTEANKIESFVPVDTIYANHNSTSGWRTLWYNLTVPTTIEGHNLAIRLTNDWYIECDILGVSVGLRQVPNLHVAHARGTNIELRWTSDTIDTLVVEYGQRNFTLGSGTLDTLVGIGRANLTGLNPNEEYDIVARYIDGVACPDFRIQTTTSREDYPLPYCEDFAGMDYVWDRWNGDWRRLDYNVNTPRISYHPWLPNAGRALDLGSYGFEGYYYTTATMPDIEIDSGTVLSFYATSPMLPSSWLVLGMWNPDYDNGYIPFDTITIGADRQHYVYPLPDSIANAEGRLTLRWWHPMEYSYRHVFIDEIHLAHVAYGSLTPTMVGFDTATFACSDSVLLTLEGGGKTFDIIYPDFAIGGLDSGTTYQMYVTPLADTANCRSYAGEFTTSSIGGGYGSCFAFDDLLSYELPLGWYFNDSARVDEGVLVFDSMAVFPYIGDISGHRLVLRTVDTDTLLVGYTTDSIGFTVTDTVTTTFATFYLDSIPADALLAFFSSDTARIDMAGVTGCPMVDFEVRSGQVICTVRGGSSMYYHLTATDTATGNDFEYHITESPYTINDLLGGHSYLFSYYCHGSNSECPTDTIITLQSNISLPYCEEFNPDGNIGFPQNWTYLYDPDVKPCLELGWGETPFRMGDWWREKQMIVLPPIEDSGAMIIKVRFFVWNDNAFQIGLVNAMGDTATYIPLDTNDHTDWEEMYVRIDSLGDRRIALRSDNLVLIDYISISKAPKVKFSLLGWRTMRLTADTPDSATDYYVRYRNDYGLDSVLHITSNPYDFVESTYNDIYLTVAVDSTGALCGRENDRWQLSALHSVPECPLNEYWHWEYRCIGDSWDDYYRGRRPHNMRINSDPNNYAYRLLPDLNIDSIRHLSMSFELAADRLNEMVEVGVMWDAYDTGTFVPIDTFHYTNEYNRWQTCRVSFDNYTGDGRWIAFRHRSGQCNDCYGELAVGNYFVTEGPAATATASLARWNKVEINASAPGFYVEYYNTDSPGQNTVTYIDEVPTILTLQEESTYEFLFRSDSLGSSCSPQRVFTGIQPLSIPCCINFDTTEAEALHGWTISDGSATVGDGVLNLSGMLTTPDIDIDSLQGVAISLWYKATQGSDRLRVGTISNPADPQTTWIAATLLTRDVDVWQHFIIDFSASPSNAHFIVLIGEGQVDNIRLDTAAAHSFSVLHLEHNAITMGWDYVGNPDINIVAMQGDSILQTYTNPTVPLIIGGLTPEASYSFLFESRTDDTGTCAMYYSDSITLVTPVAGTGCINATDLYSSSALFTTGTYANPYSLAGVVDYGPEHQNSRHTVCFDTTYRDPRTGGLLRTVPEGYTSSLRLGNWSTSAYAPEAEGAIYSLLIDTNDFELILLRYAAVLQDPMHDPADQPRFRIEVLDSNMIPIDPICTSADFIADQSLGWNTADNNVLWKDWTTVGIDLSAYAGQQVYIRLTTFDCNEGSHYGYAYFTLECMRKALETTACGDIDSNTFTAPAGFNYRWYSSADNSTIATTQSVTVPSANITYYCDVMKIDNASCLFTISAYGGTRYPMASFDTSMAISDCLFHVNFTNTSSVSTDGISPMEGEQCESAYWDFGNGQTSASYHASTVYSAPGTYTVMLVSGIAGDACTDTAFFSMTLNPIGNRGDTMATACDSFYWRGTAFAASGGATEHLQHTAVTGLPDSNGCDSTVTLHLTLHSSHTNTIDERLTENALPYLAAGVAMGGADLAAATASYSLLDSTLHTLTTEGCDSTVTVHLLVWLNRDTTIYDTTCRNLLPYIYHDSALAPAGSLLVSHFSLLTAEGADSTVTLQLTVTENPAATVCDTVVENELPHLFRGATFFGATDTLLTLAGPGCDTLMSYRLHVWPNRDTTIVRSVCRSDLPYRFDTVVFEPTDSIAADVTYSDTLTATLTDSHGADSTVTYVLEVHGVYELTDTVVVCPKHPYVYEGVDYGGPVTVSVALSTVEGCDSLVHVTLAPRDSSYRIRTLYCFDGEAWRAGNGPWLADSGRWATDSVLQGCSATTLHLMDTTPEAAMRQWTLTTDDTSAATTDSLLAFRFDLSDNPTAALASLTLTDIWGCSDTLEWPVLVWRRPKADFIWDPEVPVMSHPEVQFFNRSTTDSALWNPDTLFPLTYLWTIGSPNGGSDTSSLKDPLHSWGEGSDAISGDAPVSLVAFWEHHLDSLELSNLLNPLSPSNPLNLSSIVHTCTDTAEQTVVISNDYLQFPNLVTPNGDGINDTWVIVNLVEYGEYYENELWIYNQWGALVYHVRNIRSEEQMWDPNNTHSPAGAYYYRFTARGRFGITKRNGLIEVVR